jgi:hypothetical protein
MLRGTKKVLQGPKKVLTGAKKVLEGSKQVLGANKIVPGGSKKGLRGTMKVLNVVCDNNSIDVNGFPTSWVGCGVVQPYLGSFLVGFGGRSAEDTNLPHIYHAFTTNLPPDLPPLFFFF